MRTDKNGATPADAVIGVDVGGTHTDASAIVGSRVERGKALTTYDDFSRGVLAAVTVAAESHGLSLEQLLGRTRLFVNGTTVVTNAITTLTGARVGVLLTAGFKDTFRIAGGPRVAEFDDHLQVNAPDLVRRSDIAEIDERAGWDGVELVPLDVNQVRAAARHLVEEQGVEALAICFMSSFVAPAHELEAERVIREVYPDLFVSLSHRIFPVLGETRRWTTAVLNSFVNASARRYLDSLNENLRAAGLSGGLVFFQGLGGGISLERAKEFPLALLGSGPAGGAIGANALAQRMGISNVLLGDMGGTSFDTGIIVDNEVRVTKNLQIGLFQTGVNIIDVVSVGAGGGSIAWVGERGVPQVGPQSATSDPGPAAYATGGEDPTVTDAMVTMGFIDPDRYLGGRFRLDPELARKSLERDLTGRFGWSTEEAAAAIHDLAVMNMATAVHEVSVAKGYDPRDFVFLAYGGTLPLFAVQIADRLNISRVVIPQNSSVFSALGLLSADFVMRSDQTVAWNLDARNVANVNDVADKMVTQARSAMRAEGFADADIATARSGDFRFLGQSYELTMALPDAPLTAEAAPDLAARFFKLYEQTYGEGTAWKGVPVQLLNYSVSVIGRQHRPPVETVKPEVGDADDMRSGVRRVFLPSVREYREVHVYDDRRFTTGTTITGPAIVDASDTTIYVPPGAQATRDVFMNYILTTTGAAA